MTVPPDSERWPDVRRVLEDVADLTEPELGPALRRACAGDVDLEAEVRRHLAHDRLPEDRSTEPPTIRPLTGSRLGGFELEHPLRGGSMGTVWRARQVSPERVVALKILDPRHVSSDTERRLRQEAELLGRLSHPGIARVLAAGTEPVTGLPWFAMELVPGACSLREWVARPGSDLRRRVALLAEVCDAVQTAHDEGVLHRDLKPSNILVDELGRARVIDFGIGRVIDQDDTLTRTDDLLGTPAYMSPEQLEDPTALDGRSDVYSLGAVLYELLAGVAPFAGEPLDAERRRKLVPIRPGANATAQRVPAALDGVALKALEGDVARRYASAAALATDLRAWLDGRPLSVRPPGVWRQLRDGVRRRPVVASGVVGFGAVVGAIIGMLAYHQSESRRMVANIGRAIVLYERYAELARLNVSLIPQLESWIEDAESLASSWPDHRRQLEAAALPARQTQKWVRDGHYGYWSEKILNVFDDSIHEGVHAAIKVASENLRLIVSEDVGALSGWSSSFGDGARPRLALLRALRSESLESPGARAAWGAARAAIRVHQEYGGLDLEPQFGLLPLGPDPWSGLWEFAHLASGEPARPGSDGSLRMAPEFGVVLVLVPGGVYPQGCQCDPEEHRSRDPLCFELDEGPTEDLELQPYFLSKFELTQAQWKRAARSNPSFHHQFDADDQHGLLHPVESVDWARAREVLRWWGLALPTEARWEAACRAGGEGSWSTGPFVTDLAAAANLADVSAARAARGWRESWDDGRDRHGIVDERRPNAFGFHDMHGNVWEWCEDHYAEYVPGDRVYDPDGTRYLPNDTTRRVLRGGSFRYPAWYARTTLRMSYDPRAANDDVGIRPARDVDGLPQPEPPE